jgi:two-component system sensor histidine kinase KdpD
VLAVVFVAGLAALLSLIPPITAGAAAPVLLLAVLLIARAWGTGPALAGSVSASIGFAFYFLPLAGIFVRDLNDVVTFLAFTTTAIVVGELAARAERRQIEAEEGRREIEELYQQLGATFERASEAEAARRNEQLKAALLDALTHNLRTPLTAIKVAVTALIGANPKMPTLLSQESRHDLLKVIDEESDRLNRFIEGLSVADRSSHVEATHQQRVDLNRVVQEALTRAGTLLRHHRVVTALEADLPPIMVDPTAVAEVIYTLLDNASKYSPPETTIRVTAQREGEEYVYVSVADEGPGIAPELRERVFENFFRIPGREAFDSRRTGVGLGLPIARRLVQSQAGEIWIEAPSSGTGTLVVLKLLLGGQVSDELVSAEPVAVRA